MPKEAQSIRQGSGPLVSVDVGKFRVSDAFFPPHLTLDSHYHPRACFAVVLEGSVEKVFRTKEYALPTSTAVTMPPEERHRDYFEDAGAHMLVVEPAPDTEEFLRPCAGLLDRVHHFQHAGILNIAWRLSHEIHVEDDVTPLAIEGLVLELLAAATRRNDTTGSANDAPPWIERAQDLMHARFAEPLKVAELADAVGTHPVHLARVFREHFGVSPATYMRRLRLDFAATQLATSGKPLSEIARCAGFADQSHLTRAFKEHTGFTPGQFRQETLR